MDETLQRLEGLKTRADQLQSEMVKAQTRAEQLQAQLTELNGKLEELGITGPHDLEKLEKQLMELVVGAERELASISNDLEAIERGESIGEL